MNTEIPIYDIVLDENSIGLTAISLVDEPAIMENFVAFSKQNMIWMSSREKREVVAPLLIPDQLILRRADDGTLYYIRWRRETILQAAEKYILNGFFNNFTFMHAYFYNKDMKYEDSFEKDIYMKRLWTIEDEKNDDANTKYGFNLPVGTLMCHFKVMNRKIWQKIKNKEVLGCSIEAYTTMAKNNDKNDIHMNKLDVNAKQMNLMQKFIQFLNEVSVEAADISDIAKKDDTESGDVSLKYFIDDEHWIEVDAEGFARDAEFNLVAEGEYKLADGNVLVVNSENKFVETRPLAEENEEAPVEAPIAEKKVEDEDEKKDEEVDKPADGEDESVDDETPAEDVPTNDEEPSEASPEGEPTEVVEPTEEEPIEELVPFEIDGVEYMLPQPVIDYINQLMGDKSVIAEELAQMKERIPSAQPVGAVIKQSAVVENDNDGMDLFDAIRLLNTKR